MSFGRRSILMSKFKEWWIRDKRYVTLIKATLLALLPLLCAMARCAVQGGSIGQVYLPGSQWNDELFYYKQVEGIITYGYPQGFFGFNESHALKLSFAAWSPVLVFPWVLWGLMLGWNLMSPVICNIVLLTLACFFFVWLVKPTWKQLGIMALLFCLYTPFSRYMLSAMPEIICFSMLILFYGAAVNYVERERGYKLALLFVMAGVMTLMRPYLLLFLLLPGYFWVRKRGWKGAAGSAAVTAAVLVIYWSIKHYLGAEYFAPLFFTDWVEAFFQGGLLEGLRFTLGKLYYMGKSFGAYTLQGIRGGMASGAYFAGYLAMLGVLTAQSIKDWKRKENKGRLAIQLHMIFSFVAMLFALLLMYKLTEGSKHLLTFMAAGIFILALMDTRYYKKAVFMGAVFAYLYIYMAVDPMDYQVPFTTQERVEQVKAWEEIFREELELSLEGGTPCFENVVIWVFSDTDSTGARNTDWQLLYALPEGFGISCCMPDYIKENLDMLQSRYLAVLSGGEIDAMCAEAGYREIGRDASLVVYERIRSSQQPRTD